MVGRLKILETTLCGAELDSSYFLLHCNFTSCKYSIWLEVSVGVLRKGELASMGEELQQHHLLIATAVRGHFSRMLMEAREHVYSAILSLVYMNTFRRSGFGLAHSLQA